MMWEREQWEVFSINDIHSSSTAICTRDGQWRVPCFEAVTSVPGDDFADNGNLPLTEPVTEMLQQWAYPYGSAYADTDGFPLPNTPFGRFSNYKIQFDFISQHSALD
uniref:Uncharacterized protein n=1 Tax=Aegilops tauschii subsp. strangulata TaxID=200361 RepID=A0A453LYS0_AEGTS